MGWRGDGSGPARDWRGAVGFGLTLVVLLALAVAKGLSRGNAMDAVHRAGRPVQFEALYRR